MKLKYTFETMELDDHVVAVPVGESADALHSVIKLNETAAAIINLLKEEISEEQLIEELKKTYSDENGDMADKVRRYLQQLRDADLLE